MTASPSVRAIVVFDVVCSSQGIIKGVVSFTGDGLLTFFREPVYMHKHELVYIYFVLVLADFASIFH